MVCGSIGFSLIEISSAQELVFHMQPAALVMQKKIMFFFFLSNRAEMLTSETLFVTNAISGKKLTKKMIVFINFVFLNVMSPYRIRIFKILTIAQTSHLYEALSDRKNSDWQNIARGRNKTKYVQRKHRKYSRRQRSGFLNRYNFVYAARDTLNQAVKEFDAVAPKLIK